MKSLRWMGLPWFFGLLVWVVLSWNALGAAEVSGQASKSSVSESPAHRAIAHFRRGANLGNHLEVPPGENWAVQISEKDFERIHSEGFDHVRIPVAWHHYVKPGSQSGMELKPEIFERVDRLIRWARAQRLSILINLHHYDAFTTDPSGHVESLSALWRQIAAHYTGQPTDLAFEILNEPRDAATTEVMNPIYAQIISEIRRNHPDRTLFVGPGKWNQIQELKHLKLPEGDRNLVVTVHCYEPFFFTHQGATWSGPDTQVTGIQFPGPPVEPLKVDAALKLNPWVVKWLERYNTLPSDQNPSGPVAFDKLLKEARAWSEKEGRPVHVGEFGCYTRADSESRARYYRAVRESLDREGLGWAIWDWNSGFHYWDSSAGRSAQGMREALFGTHR